MRSSQRLTNKIKPHNFFYIFGSIMTNPTICLINCNRPDKKTLYLLREKTITYISIHMLCIGNLNASSENNQYHHLISYVTEMNAFDIRQGNSGMRAWFH